MDIKTLEALGISPEELGDRVVDQCVESLLNSTVSGPACSMIQRTSSVGYGVNFIERRT